MPPEFSLPAIGARINIEGQTGVQLFSLEKRYIRDDAHVASQTGVSDACWKPFKEEANRILEEMTQKMRLPFYLHRFGMLLGGFMVPLVLISGFGGADRKKDGLPINKFLLFALVLMSITAMAIAHFWIRSIQNQSMESIRRACTKASSSCPNKFFSVEKDYVSVGRSQRMALYILVSDTSHFAVTVPFAQPAVMGNTTPVGTTVAETVCQKSG